MLHTSFVEVTKGFLAGGWFIHVKSFLHGRWYIHTGDSKVGFVGFKVGFFLDASHLSH